ncbi:hypothetical protein V5O48_007651, partial [Marasmius crinis-equi]
MEKQQAIREVIATHDLTLRRVKDEISKLNEKLVVLSLQDREISLATMDSKVRSIRASLLTKIQEQIAAEKLLSMHRSISSPALLLPYEIWAHILSLSMPDTRYPTWDMQFPPVVFGRVCSQFRSMIRLMPELWSSISLDILPGMKNRRPPWMPLIPAFLNRSRDHPLSLQLIWYRSKLKEDRVLEPQLLELVTSCSVRWRDLRITVPREYLHRFFERPLLQLETLTVGGEDDTPARICITHAPRLRSVTFSSIYLRPQSWDIPWSQITELVSRSCLNVSAAKGILVGCPRLKRCQLRIVPNGNPVVLNDVDARDPIQGMIVLPALKKFTMVVGYDEDVSYFLSHFEFPALEEIEFNSIQQTPVMANNRVTFWPMANLL